MVPLQHVQPIAPENQVQPSHYHCIVAETTATHVTCTFVGTSSKTSTSTFFPIFIVILVCLMLFPLLWLLQVPVPLPLLNSIVSFVSHPHIAATSSVLSRNQQRARQRHVAHGVREPTQVRAIELQRVLQCAVLERNTDVL